MATVTTYSREADFFDLFETSFKPSGATINHDASTFEYVTGSGGTPNKPSYTLHEVLAGSNFTYGPDPSNGPTGGSIGAVYFVSHSVPEPPPPPPPITQEDQDIANAWFAIDARDNPIAIPAGFTFDSTDTFWRTMLQGGDTIDIKLRTVPVFSGDGRDVASGATVFGAFDQITVSYSEAATTDGSSLPVPEIYGDFRNVLDGATVHSGDDTINWVAASGDGTAIVAGRVSGDVKGVGDQSNPSSVGTVYGGSDSIDISGVVTDGTIVAGDALDVFGSSLVVGGSDFITGSNFADTIGGDARNLIGTVTLIGGGDVIFGGAGNDHIYGDYINWDFLAVITGGNDTIIGGAGADTMYGQGGDDTFIIDSVADYAPAEFIDGGSGADRIRFTSTMDGETFALHSSLAGVEILEITDVNGVSTGTGAVNIDASQVGYGIELDGNAGANALTGTSFADIIRGGAGGDILAGGAGVDSLHGSNDGDTLRVGADDGVGETYDGGDGIDTMELYGPGSYDINLRDDNVNIDHIAFDDPGAGNKARVRMLDSQMSGSWGYLSIVDFSARTNIFDLAVGIGGSVHMPLVQFNNFTLDDQLLITGASGTETVTGSSVADTIDGQGGSDVLDGFGGADIFLIASQAEHPATETIDGGSGTDRIRFTSTSPGQALVLSSHVSNVEIAEITDAAGNATGTTALNLSAALVQQGMQLRGNAGDNTLVGSAFVDVMAGGAGNDKYYVANTNDTVTEAVGKGSDTIYASTSYTLGAGQEIELLQANAGSNALTLTGNSFANAFVSGAGTDTMAGLGGNDTYYVNNGGDFVNEAVGGGIDTVKAGASYTLGAGQEIENVIANAGSTGLTLTGNAFGNSFTSGAGNDTLAGLGGNDVYYVNNTGDIVNEAVGGGSDAISTSANYTLKAGQEIETLAANAGNTALTLTGNALANTLVSGKGVDTLVGLGGDDRYFVNFALDKVTEAVGGGNDTVYSTVTYTLAAGQEIEVLSANAGSTGITLTGNAFANSLVSGAGNDTLAGLGGNDTYFVNNAGDIVQEAIGGGTNDTVRASVDYTLGANQEIERLLANAGSTGVKLTGNNLANYLLGGAGGDTLTGGLGVDSFTGAGGSDIFVFNDVADSGISTPDSILDFTAGDKIDLHLIDSDGNGGNGDTAFTLDNLGDNSFATGHIKQTIAGNTLYLSFNTDADPASEMTIALLHHGAAINVGDLIA